MHYLTVNTFICCLMYCNGDITDNIRNSYDYIIVGGGTAGAVLANRLTAESAIRVLVLEAGYEPHNMTHMPFSAPALQLTELDWQYKTVPQKDSCLGIKEQRTRHPRGKALGGSSVINYMMFVRGTKKDYDKWAENGATGWGWRDIFPYFIKYEDNKDPSISSNGYHGLNGELPVSRTNYYTPLAQAYVEAAKELNFPEGDFNAENPESFMVFQGMIRNGERWSTHRAFLKPVLKRRNLDVAVGAFVTKILFDNSNRAIGVQFDHNNQTKTVAARIEVLLSAGAFASPQLLMLSGIGPREELQRHGIPVLVDLPGVGKNLQDHVTTGVPFLINKPYSLRMSRVVVNGVVSFYFGQGPLSSIGVEAVGFYSTKYSNESHWPDIEFMFVSYTPSTDDGIVARTMHGINDELWEKVFEPYLEQDSFLCTPLVMHPNSLGEVTLASADPYEHPNIDPKWFTQEPDLKVIVEGMKKCYEFANTNVMKQFGAKPFETVFPGCEKYERFSDEELACMAKSYTLTNYHPCGTCKMGNPADPTTVVDPQLKVKGVRGLRIVDASIMPKINTGHTEPPVLMIAEKASDMILDDYFKFSNDVIR